MRRPRRVAANDCRRRGDGSQNDGSKPVQQECDRERGSPPGKADSGQSAIRPFANLLCLNPCTAGVRSSLRRSILILSINNRRRAVTGLKLIHNQPLVLGGLMHSPDNPGEWNGREAMLVFLFTFFVLGVSCGFWLTHRATRRELERIERQVDRLGSLTESCAQALQLECWEQQMDDYYQENGR